MLLRGLCMQCPVSASEYSKRDGIFKTNQSYNKVHRLKNNEEIRI